MTGFQLLPHLPVDDYAALHAEIKAHGVLVPINVDENDVILDGHHRHQIATELGIHCPRHVIKGLHNDTSKRTFALTVNTNRRQLTSEQRREIARTSLRADPQLSDREHARRTGLSDKTVGVLRTEMEATAEIPQLKSRVGADGKPRPASQPRPAALPSGELATSAADGPGAASSGRSTTSDDESADLPTVQLDSRNSEALMDAEVVLAAATATAATPTTPSVTSMAGTAAPESAEPTELREDASATSRSPVDERNQWAPDDRRAHEASVRRKQDIEAARDAANNIATLVLSAAGTVVIGCRHGEPNLVTREMVASIRQAADLLEKEL